MRGNFVYQRLGKAILIRRKKKELSQEELAILSQIDRTYVGRLEQGTANPSFKIIVKIAKALRVKLSELLKGV